MINKYKIIGDRKYLFKEKRFDKAIQLEKNTYVEIENPIKSLRQPFTLFLTIDWVWMNKYSGIFKMGKDIKIMSFIFYDNKNFKIYFAVGNDTTHSKKYIDMRKLSNAERHGESNNLILMNDGKGKLYVIMNAPYLSFLTLEVPEDLIDNELGNVIQIGDFPDIQDYSTDEYGLMVSKVELYDEFFSYADLLKKDEYDSESRFDTSKSIAKVYSGLILTYITFNNEVFDVISHHYLPYENIDFYESDTGLGISGDFNSKKSKISFRNVTKIKSVCGFFKLKDIKNSDDTILFKLIEDDGTQRVVLKANTTNSGNKNVEGDNVKCIIDNTIDVSDYSGKCLVNDTEWHFFYLEWDNTSSRGFSYFGNDENFSGENFNGYMDDLIVCKDKLSSDVLENFYSILKFKYNFIKE